METPELKPCPFCGSDRVQILGRGSEPYYVNCKACDAEGPVEYNETAAVKSWNTRAEVKAEEKAEAKGIMDSDLLRCSRALSRGEEPPHGRNCFCLVASAAAQAVEIGKGEVCEGAIQEMAMTLALGILGPERLAELAKGEEEKGAEGR